MSGKILSIGNGSYEHIQPHLPNAVNDATEVAQAFEQMGYDVQTCIDKTAGEIIEQVKSFANSIQDGEIAVLYYAGHGCQVVEHNGLSVNCIMGKDSLMNSDNGGEALGTAIILQEHIIDVLDSSKAMIKVFLIDACRIDIPLSRGNDQPFKTGFSSNVKSTRGSLISFSTSSGKNASDGTDGHSPYAKALLEYCREDCSIEDCLKKVRHSVYANTGNVQISWEYTSLMGNFQFNYANSADNHEDIQHAEVHEGLYTYSQNAMADSTYDDTDSNNPVDIIIQKLKTHDWYQQNAGIMKLYGVGTDEATPDQQFILGRNILQTAIGGEYECMSIMDGRLANFLIRWSKKGENHILNGMLYEMYFDHNAEFRGASHAKSSYLEQLVKLLNTQQFEKSKLFIQQQLAAYRDRLYYFPTENNPISILVRLQPHHLNDEFQEFRSLQINNREIVVVEMEQMFKSFKNTTLIKRQLSHELCAPMEMLDLTFDPQVAENVEIEFPLYLTRSLNIN